MFSTVTSAAVFGVEARLVHVEADVSDGLPSFAMVGFLSAQVKEAQERVRTALKNAGFRMSPKRITVNLSPADMRKSGTGFDLPIAVAVAAAYGEIAQERLAHVMIAGELSLNGEVLGMPGILPIVAGAKENGCRICIVPKANEQEALTLQGIQIVGVRELREAIEYLQGVREIPCAERKAQAWQAESSGAEDFADVSGQEAARRAIEVAVAGGHNLLMVGPPGAGKSLLAKRISGILPPMTEEECLEITKIYSVAGQLGAGGFLGARPFRAPHHTVTAKALAGGGNYPRPGEVSLAHCGVLFLDELPEFSREALEILRQPMEERAVHIARNGVSYRFPANFMLVAAMNPCPCGHYPDVRKCSCTPAAVQRYLNRISAPLLERIDITVEVPQVGYGELQDARTGECSAVIRERVAAARVIQKERYRERTSPCNAALSQQEISVYCRLGKAEQALMREAFEKLDLSARTYFRVLKVGRTIADLAGKAQIGTEHLQEALCYRSIGKKYWLER